MGTISWDVFARAAKMGFIIAYIILSFGMSALLVCVLFWRLLVFCRTIRIVDQLMY